MSVEILPPRETLHALALRDLTDPRQGTHAMQMLVASASSALAERWGCDRWRHHGHPVVSVEDNYDHLGYPADGPARDARYTRYVSEVQLLRSHTSAMVPALLRRLASAPRDDVLLVVPGIVYRRDSIDRIHTGEPHQLDLWRLRRGPPLTSEDLQEMVAVVVEALCPGRPYRALAAEHPYTEEGLQIDVAHDGWLEIGECGLAHPEVLRGAGLQPPTWSGLAMGLGLDRLLMLAKGIDDIRLLRSSDPRVTSQMQDLSPYRPVSRQPAIVRDLSLALGAAVTAEEIGDRVRAALGPDADAIEEATVLSETPHRALPDRAIARLGMAPGQKNVLLRLVIRDIRRALRDDEANLLRDRVYASLHEGAVHQWARGKPPDHRG